MPGSRPAAFGARVFAFSQSISEIHRAAAFLPVLIGKAQSIFALGSPLCRNKVFSLLTMSIYISSARYGQTFLAKIFGWKACQANQRVLFTTAMDMLNQLLASQVDHSLVRKLKTYTEPTLLLVDELGYLSLDQQTSNLFYQVISTRHSQKRSTIITTNTPFSDWGNILFNTTIATAIADRLVENSEIFLLGGDSLRKASKNPTSPEE